MIATILSQSVLNHSYFLQVAGGGLAAPRQLHAAQSVGARDLLAPLFVVVGDPRTMLPLPPRDKLNPQRHRNNNEKTFPLTSVMTHFRKCEQTMGANRYDEGFVVLKNEMALYANTMCRGWPRNTFLRLKGRNSTATNT